MDDRETVEAIQAQRLADHARAVAAGQPSERDAELAQRAVETCARIAAEVHDAQRDAVAALAEADITARPWDAGDALQRHEFVVELDRASARSAAAVLGARGYRPEHDLADGAARSQLHHGHELVVRRTDRWTTVARLRWRSRSAPTTLRRLFVPTPADWTMVSLPKWAWWGYSVLRPVRQVLERVGRRPRDHADLEPFLATPDSLIDPLLDAAGVSDDDVVVDIGCGDGRIVVEAAVRRNCRAIGVEQSQRLAADAERRAATAGVDDRVEIVHGDAHELDLGEATVAFMFLPIGIACEVVPRAIASMPSGSRILVHEQSRLPVDMPAPDRSTPLIGDDAVSVAHVWIVGTRTPLESSDH